MLRRETYLPGEAPPTHRIRVVDAVSRFALAALALTAVFYGVVLLCAASCSVHDIEQPFKQAGADFAEVSYCEFEHCGQVFLCTMSDGTKNEWCWMDDSATELEQASGADSCVPTPRGGQLGWPCLYCCGSKCGRGANAYQGSFCS